MKKLSTKNIFLVIFSLLLIAIFWRFVTELSFPDASISLQKGALVKLQPENSLTQKFVAARDGLTKVEFLLRTPGIAFENKDKVEMELADETCQHSLQKGELRSSFLASDNLYEFNFEKVATSKNKTFCLVATFKPVKASAKAIQFFTSGTDPAQPLSIRPVYQNQNIWQNLHELESRLSQYKPWFLKNYFLWFIILGFIFLSVILVAILIVI